MDEIKEGNIVTVNFNNIEVTWCAKARVLHVPCATGDSWHLKDIETGVIHYISEGCTISKYENEQTTEADTRKPGAA